MTETRDEKGRVPYRECIALRGGPRDGELHACAPSVYGLLLSPKAPEHTGLEFWLRTPDADEKGHTYFMLIDDVQTPGQLDPMARRAVGWKELQNR